MRKAFTSWTEKEVRAYYDEETKTFVPLEVTKEEKERIINKHSIYILDEYEYKTYQAVCKICEGLAHFQTSDAVNDIPPSKMLNALHFLWPYLQSRRAPGRFAKGIIIWEPKLEVWGKE